jgi:hypothetical protein
MAEKKNQDRMFLLCLSLVFFLISKCSLCVLQCEILTRKEWIFFFFRYYVLQKFCKGSFHLSLFFFFYYFSFFFVCSYLCFGHINHCWVNQSAFFAWQFWKLAPTVHSSPTPLKHFVVTLITKHTYSSLSFTNVNRHFI